MKIYFHHPKRIEEVQGPKKVSQLLRELDILPETVLVILKKGESDSENELLAPDGQVEDGDQVEIRPVISGGAR